MSTKSIILGGALALTLFVAGAAQAHEAGKGRNGGVRVDAGKFHTELLVDGTDKVNVFLSDADDKPVEAKGFKATAIFILDGKSQRFTLQPDNGPKLVGTAPAPVPVGAKGIVQLTAPDGQTSQAKF